ncbi:hypothetical protein [Streptomyces johnsoniae]|uniref:Cellulose-binding protein n=1 Tax=Streptomyces johnsoniae TaxID=3075532 RepID=A0ABU2RZN2_9ACTN|nr:hypothetical protein [Streptomyces sp. DSM 41886]MDT0442221.1 hypothetical protein [Streptomyces sp. DSM 41886]
MRVKSRLRRAVRLPGLVGAVLLAVAAALVSGPPAAAADGPSARAAEPWNPPAQYAQGLDEVWQHVESTYPDLYGFRNYGWDQLIANEGTFTYCVRWESATPVTAATRDRIETVLQEQWAKWFDGMRGFDGFPYQQVPVEVVGWAATNDGVLQWDDDAVDRYIGILDGAGAPQCAPECGRFFNQDGDYSRCPGGEARHYDQSLWLTDGFGGGAGGDWGQRMGQEYFSGALGQEDITILLHEMGHTLGLDDFYDWTPTGAGGFLMKAGAASHVTEFDTWMARDFWRHLKDRYGIGAARHA